MTQLMKGVAMRNRFYATQKSLRFILVRVTRWIEGGEKELIVVGVCSSLVVLQRGFKLNCLTLKKV